MRLLIVEDDSDVARLVGYCARVLWPEVQLSIAADGAAALRQFAAAPPDLVILDLTIPRPTASGSVATSARPRPTCPS
jgi:DNA-binding response OmpR family regulator